MWDILSYLIALFASSCVIAPYALWLQNSEFSGITAVFVLLLGILCVVLAVVVFLGTLALFDKAQGRIGSVADIMRQKREEKRKTTKQKNIEYFLEQREKAKEKTTVGNSAAVAITVCLIVVGAFFVVMLSTLTDSAPNATTPQSNADWKIQQAQYQEKFSSASSEGRKQSEKYKTEYQKTNYKFVYYDLSTSDLTNAISSARKHATYISEKTEVFILNPTPQNYLSMVDGISISQHKGCDLFYSKAQINSLNQLLKELCSEKPEYSNLVNGYHLIQDVLVYFDYVKKISSFYSNTSLNSLLSQENKLNTTLLWTEQAIAAYYPYEYTFGMYKYAK